MKSRDRESHGIILGALAYTIWGIAPLFWLTLTPAKPMEVLAHRVVWSMLLLGILVRWQGRMPHVRAAFADRRTLRLLIVASVLVGLNWGIFIWATMSDHVLDAALGYYTVPLLSVALGVVFLRERLRPLQWTSISIAAASVVYVTVDNGSLPWIGLSLAGTWVVYGYIKKIAGVDAIESLAIETVILTPLAVAFIVYMEVTGTSSFGHHGTGHVLAMMSAGLFTAAPLLLFGGAIVRAPLSTIGFLQYISSTIQFGLGVWAFHEPIPRARLVGFAVTWVALMVLTYDGVRSRRGLPAAAIAEPD